jgi:hypothetical protein
MKSLQWCCRLVEGPLEGVEVLHWQARAAVVLMLVSICSVLWPAKPAPWPEPASAAN